MWNEFLFTALPYISLLLFVGGSIYRGFAGIMGRHRGRWNLTVRGDYYWTTRSTAFFGRASIGPAALSLHWGLALLFLAHVVGFVGGAYMMPGWVDTFRWAGLAAGLLVLYGLTWAFVRRVTIPQLRAMSRVEDHAVLALLALITGFGLYQSAVELVFGISYSVGPWLAGVFTLRPNASLMAGVPLVNQLHVITAMVFFAYFPFTKLVHVFSYPFSYFSRPFITVRRYQGAKS